MEDLDLIQTMTFFLMCFPIGYRLPAFVGGYTKTTAWSTHVGWWVNTWDGAEFEPV